MILRDSKKKQTNKHRQLKNDSFNLEDITQQMIREGTFLIGGGGGGVGRGFGGEGHL